MSLAQRIDQEANRIVNEWGQDLTATTARNVRAQGMVDTGAGADSFSHQAKRNGDLNYQVELSFDRAIRMADQGAGFMYEKGVYQGREERTDMLLGRKGNPAYSRAAYGRISGLVNLLANMHVEEVAEGLKDEIQPAS